MYTQKYMSILIKFIHLFLTYGCLTLNNSFTLGKIQIITFNLHKTISEQDGIILEIKVDFFF